VADRRPRAGLVLALACLLAAGCSAGVPRTGKVTSVTRVASPNEHDLARSGGQSWRLTPGLDPVELVQRYLGVTSSGDPRVAKPWVVPGAASQVAAWSKHHSAWVWANLSTPNLLAPPRHGEAKVAVEVSLVGHFDGREWTPLAGERRLEFRLRRVGAEWRIANPDDEPWMSDEAFKERFRRVTLYMVARDHRHLVPAPTFFAQDDDRAVEPLTADVLHRLLQGPRGRLAPSMATAIPAGTRLQSFHYDSLADLATVNLSGEFTAPGEPRSGQLRMAQLVRTVTGLVPTAEVQVQVEGHEVGTVGPDHFRADRAYRGSAPELDALWPRRRGSQNAVAFVRNGQVFTVPVDPPNADPTPLHLPPPSGQKLHPVWAPDGHQLAYLATTGTGGEPELWTATGSGADPVNSGLRGDLSEPTWVPSDPARLLVLQHANGKALLWSLTPGTNGGLTRLSLGHPPAGMDPTLLRVSADGSLVLAVMGGPEQHAEDPAGVDAENEQLYLGVLGDRGVTTWVQHPLAPGLGEVQSPAWVDPDTIAFVGEAGTKGSKALWTVRLDGWDPTQVLASGRGPGMVDVADQLTVDPSGQVLVFKTSTDLSSSLWLVNLDGRGLRPLTSDPSGSSLLDSDPSLASE
jgi:hypothetical protein